MRLKLAFSKICMENFYGFMDQVGVPVFVGVMCGLGLFGLLSQCIDVLVDTPLGSVKKRNFLLTACSSVFCSVFAVIVIGFVRLATHDQLRVVEPKTESFVQNEQAHQEFLERIFKQRVLDQSGCFTWTMLDQGFRLEDIMIMLNTIYKLDASQNLSKLDINDVFFKAEETKTEWRLNRQKPKSQQTTCTPEGLLEKNQKLKRGSGLTYETRTRLWPKYLRQSIYWICGVEGLYTLGVDIAGWWPGK